MEEDQAFVWRGLMVGYKRDSAHLRCALMLLTASCHGDFSL